MTPTAASPASLVVPDLGTLHGFTPSQLEANRAGLLHADQIAAGVDRGISDVRFGRWLLMLAAVLLLAGVATSTFPRAIKDFDFHFEWPPRLPQVLIGLCLGALVSAIPWVLGYCICRDGRRLIATYRRGVAAVALGPVRPVVVRRAGRTTEFYLVDKIQLSISRRARGTMPPGQIHRVYYVQGEYAVISLEPVA
jgi:hypothetical protein